MMHQHLGLAGPCDWRSFPLVYDEVLRKTLRQGPEEVNARTGRAIKSHPYGPVSFSVDLSDGYLPLVGCRKLFPATAAAETAWYLMGTQDPEFMLKHARVVWEKFLEPAYPPPEGEGQGTPWSLTVPLIIKAAYGYRWRKHFGRDQISGAIQALRKNPTDRRVYVAAWDPSEDGLGAEGQLNVPCPVGFTFSVVDGGLNSAYTLRSSDIFVGLPYDVMGHAMLMAAVAADLGVKLGKMSFQLAHPHLYDRHYEMAEQALRTQPVISPIPLLGLGVDAIATDPDGYVATVKDSASQAKWPDFCPRPEVVA